MLVTLQEVKDHCAVDTDALDARLSRIAEDASDAVLGWLGKPWRAYVPSGALDSNGDPVPAVDSNGDWLVKPRVRRAVLLECASQFRFPDGEGAAAVPSHWGHGHALCAGATAQLVTLRKSLAI